MATVTSSELRSVTAYAVVEGSHPLQQYAARYSNNPFLKAAAWDRLRVAGDIFDDDLGEDIGEGKTDPVPEKKVKTFEDCLIYAGLTDVKWFACHNYYDVALGVRGGKVIGVHFRSVTNSGQHPDPEIVKLWSEGYAYLPRIQKEFPLDKKIVENVSFFYEKEYITRWKPLFDGQLKAKDLKGGSKPKMGLKDVMIMTKVIKGPEKKTPIVDLIINSNPNEDMQDELFSVKKNKYNSEKLHYLKVIEISINGREWTLDPDTLKSRAVQNFMWALPTDIYSTTAEVTINLNKYRAFKMKDFLPVLLNNLTREPTSLVIELSRVVEWIENNKDAVK